MCLFLNYARRYVPHTQRPKCYESFEYLGDGFVPFVSSSCLLRPLLPAVSFSFLFAFFFALSSSSADLFSSGFSGISFVSGLFSFSSFFFALSSSSGDSFPSTFSGVSLSLGSPSLLLSLRSPLPQEAHCHPSLFFSLGCPLSLGSPP